jgi:hypothetical protein
VAAATTDNPELWKARWIAEPADAVTNVEANTVEVLDYRLQELIPELAKLNGIDLPRYPAVALPGETYTRKRLDEL